MIVIFWKCVGKTLAGLHVVDYYGPVSLCPRQLLLSGLDSLYIGFDSIVFEAFNVDAEEVLADVFVSVV